MRYEQFKIKVKPLPIINWQYLKMILNSNQTLKNQLLRWQKAGKVIRLKKNFYILNEDDRKINPSRLFIACELYRPSYISMEYALSFYGLIPERVADITCITTKKTSDYENALGKFIYQHIKTNCFTGFTELKDEANLTYYMATPEKSTVDFIYLNLKRFDYPFKAVLIDSFRFQNLSMLNKERLLYYGSLLGSMKLNEILRQVK